MTAIPADDPRRGGRRSGPSPVTDDGRRIHRRGRYSHKDKLIAVVATETLGIPETARALRVTHQTLKQWRDDEELRPYVEGARRQIMGDVTTVAAKVWREALVRITNEPDAIPMRELIALASESTNKMQLLGGGATSRTESFTITEHFTEPETQELVNLARQYLAGHGPRARSALAVGPGLEVPAKEKPDPA